MRPITESIKPSKNPPKPRFAYWEIEEAVRQAQERGKLRGFGSDGLTLPMVLTILYNFSVAGNWLEEGRVFRYVCPREDLSLDEDLTFHSGLFAMLGITHKKNVRDIGAEEADNLIVEEDTNCEENQ